MPVIISGAAVPASGSWPEIAAQTVSCKAQDQVTHCIQDRQLGYAPSGLALSDRGNRRHGPLLQTEAGKVHSHAHMPPAYLLEFLITPCGLPKALDMDNRALPLLPPKYAHPPGQNGGQHWLTNTMRAAACGTMIVQGQQCPGQGLSIITQA